MILKDWQFNIFNSIKGSFYDGGFWLRIGAFGISVMDKIKHPPIFSERNGYVQIYRIGKYGLRFLKKERIV